MSARELPGALPAPADLLDPRAAVRAHEPRPTLVLLHGFLGRPAQWSPLLAALADAPASVRLELPGHGPRPWFPRESTFDAAVDALAERLPPSGPVVLVGYSMGARLALALALRRPGRIATAVLIGVHAGLRDERARSERRRWDDAQSSQLERGGLAAFVRAWEALPLFETQRSVSPERLDAQRRERLEHTVEGLAWAIRALGLGRMPPRDVGLREAPMPLWFVAGARDAKFAALVPELARTAPRGRAELIEGAGHNVVLEAPDALARLLARALAATTRATSEMTPDAGACGTGASRSEVL